MAVDGTDYMDDALVAEIGRKKRENYKQAPDFAWVWRMNELSRDGTAELVSRD